MKTVLELRMYSSLFNRLFAVIGFRGCDTASICGLISGDNYEPTIFV